MDELNGYPTPLSPLRFQSQLGKQLKRVYKEGNNVVRLSLARVTKVNYKYNTVEVITTIHKNSTIKNPADNGRYSARLPVTFSGRTPDGKVYGSNTLVTIGSLVLIGFIEGNKDNPIVLNIYGEPDNQSQLTRTTYSSADESDESLQRELWQLFSLYPSMTYKNIDGRGNQEVTFTGKSFIFITDTDQNNDYINDVAFDYDHLPSSRYANGDLIEPTSPNAPTVLYVHQAIYDKHRVTFFIKSDGTVRLASRNINGQGVTYQELKTDGSFSIVQKQDTVNPEEDSNKFSEISIKKNGNILLKSPDHNLEITHDGIMVDGKPIGSIIGDNSKAISDLQDGLKDVTTSITVMNGKIETKVSETDYKIDASSIQADTDKLKADIQTSLTNFNTSLNSLQSYTNTAFSDGTVTLDEKSSLTAQLTDLAAKKDALVGKYTIVHSDTYLNDTNKALIENAKTDLDNKFQELQNAINLAVTDGTISSDESSSVSTAIANMSTSANSLVTALNTAADAINTAKIKAAATSPLGYLKGEISTTSSTFTQLANSVATKVESSTYTTDVQDINIKQAALQSTVDLQQQKLDTQQKTIDNTVKNIPYRVQLMSTNGLQFKNGVINTRIIATVYHGTKDITNTLSSDNFIWSRISDDADGDAAWNQAHVGAGSFIDITADDVPTNATFECDIDINTTN